MLNIKDALYSGIHTVQENAKRSMRLLLPVLYMVSKLLQLKPEMH